MIENIIKAIKHWVCGIRLYVAILIAIVGVSTYLVIATLYPFATTQTIRLEQAYAWEALACLYLAMLIGPLCAVTAISFKQQLYDARRIIGIGAASFATLHAGIATLKQFGGIQNVLQLPSNYKLAILIGLIALIVLIAMAVTSFNKAQKILGKWWFRLHKLVYLALILSVYHAAFIGSHARQLGLTIPRVVLILLGILFVFQVAAFAQKPKKHITGYITLGLCALLLAMGFGKSVWQPFNGIGVNNQNNIRQAK